MHRTLCALAATAGLAAQASATWSIVLINTRTGEVALGSATCLTNFDLQAGTPVLLPGIGGATAQSSVDSNGFNRVFIRDRMLEGFTPAEILTLLEDFDGAHQTRQYGMGDVTGETATFTGSRAGQWAGGVTGRVGEIVYAVQGNVLAGAPVVDETEQVIVTALSGGLDIPAAMMLAMQEARLWGGDGRCSCGNDADGCGSPPDGWDWETGKSAHIAYMLTARAGDGFGCNSIYKTARAPHGLAAADFNNDGLTDLAAGCRNASTIDVMLGTDLSPHYVTLAPAHSAPASGAVTGIAAADFDQDGNADLAYADSSGSLVGVLMGRGDGTFDLVPDITIIAGGPTWLAVADFNGDEWPDLASSNADGGTVAILLNDGAGSLAISQEIAIGVRPASIIAAEIDGVGGIDLACTDQTGDTLSILIGDGAGGVALWQTLATDDNPLGVAAGDYDGDGRTDLATANRNGRAINVFRQIAQGSFQRAAIASGAQHASIETIDANGDGIDDLAAGQDGGGGNLAILLGQEDGYPIKEGDYALIGGSNDLLFADLTGDGRGDIVTNARAANGVMAVAALDPAEGRGLFNNGVGCATADYFMEFNIAFQSRDAPDPVIQLQDLFDAWRQDLIGVTDAVRSIADPATDRLPVGSTTEILVEPLDWQQNPVGPGLDLGAAHAAGSAGLTVIADAHDNGDGTYSIELNASDLPADARGLDRIEIRVEHTDRNVVLMPALSIRIVGSIADWNGDGTVDPSDLAAYLADWGAREAETDLNGDGSIDTLDLLDYLRIWAGN